MLVQHGRLAKVSRDEDSGRRAGKGVGRMERKGRGGGGGAGVVPMGAIGIRESIKARVAPGTRSSSIRACWRLAARPRADNCPLNNQGAKERGLLMTRATPT